MKPLITVDEQVQFLGPYNELIPMRLKDIWQYQVEEETSTICLNLEKLVDINTKLNFVVMIYQQSYNFQENIMLIYDIEQMAFTLRIEINPNQKNMHYVYTDD